MVYICCNDCSFDSNQLIHNRTLLTFWPQCCGFHQSTHWAKNRSTHCCFAPCVLWWRPQHRGWNVSKFLLWISWLESKEQSLQWQTASRESHFMITSSMLVTEFIYYMLYSAERVVCNLSFTTREKLRIFSTNCVLLYGRVCSWR